MENKEMKHQRMRYCVERPVFREQEIGHSLPRSTNTIQSLFGAAKLKVRCSRSKAKALLFQFLPILHWLPHYPLKEWLLGDIVSGISVGILQLPQGLAYALLAGVPPVFGLYSSFFPVFVYSFFGTSRHVSVGSFAVVSIMIGSVTESLVPNDNFILPGNETVIDTIARDKARVELVAAMTLLVGLIQSLVSLFSRIHKTNIGTLVVSLIALIILFAVKEVNQRFQSHLCMPIPIELVVLIISTAVSYGVNLYGNYGVGIVGDIPTGLVAPTVPNAELFVHIAGNAFAIAVVGYAISISLAKMFAMKHRYKVDSNQELIALGLSNITGSFFHCFAVTSSMSRSLVQDSTGGNTQIAGSISSIIILVIILKAGELFTCLPRAILSAIVIANLKGMYKQFLDIHLLWRTNKYDLLIWIVTFLSTICLNLDIGLAVSVVFGLFTVTFRTQLPHYSILGQVVESDIYRDAEENTLAKEIPGVKIFQSSSPIYFANAELYAKSLKMKIGVNVDKLIEKKKKAIQKRKKGLQKVINLAKMILAKTQKGIGLDFLTNKEEVIGSLKTLSESIPQSPVTLRSLGLEKLDFHSLILDFSAVSFIDTVGTKILKNIFKEFQEVEVDVYIVNCSSSVLQQLENSNFFNGNITRASIFASIHDAVSYVSSGQNSESSSLSEITAI